MNAKHTAGPWKIAGQYTGTKVYRICAGLYTIANSEHPAHGYKDTPHDEKECAANANLIAAAPDLLATLELVQEVLTHTSNTLEHAQVSNDTRHEISSECEFSRGYVRSALIEVRAAIAKARGE